MTGTTTLVGVNGAVVYRVALNLDKRWTYTALHRFNGHDGCQSQAALVMDKKGNLYSTTTLGGSRGLGVAFEITP